MTVPFRIERTRNKHSHAVYLDQMIVIRLAKNLSTTQEHEHVENLLRRMAKRVAKEHQKIPIDPFREHLKGDKRKDRALLRFLWRRLSMKELPRMQQLVQQINDETFQVPIRSVRLRFARTQWGSCSRSGNIMLSTALLFVPPDLQRYVIIHELAHCLHANHSKAYWREVARFEPDHKAKRKALAQFRIRSVD